MFHQIYNLKIILNLCNLKFFNDNWATYENDENAHQYCSYYMHNSGATYAILNCPEECETF